MTKKRITDINCIYLYRLLFCLALSCFTPRYSTAQEQRSLWTDNLYNNLKDTTSIRLAVQQADAVFKINKDSARSIVLTTLQKSKALHFRQGILHSLNLLGFFAQFSGDYNSALHFFLQAVPYTNYPQNFNMAPFIFSNIGGTYAYLGRYELALQSFNKALVALTRSNKKDKYNDSIVAYNNIATIWNILEEKREALRVYKKAADIAQIHNNTEYMASATANIAIVYYDMGHSDTAEKQFHLAMEYAGKTADYKNIVIALTGLAYIYEKKKDYTTALYYSRRAIALTDSVAIPANITIDSRVALGTVYLGMKDYSKAADLFADAFEGATKMNKKETIQVLRVKMAEVYAATGKYPNAYEYMRQYVVVNDSLLKQEKNQLLEVWMNIRKAENEKELLQNQLRIGRQQSELQRKSQWIGGTVLTALLLLSVSAGFTYYYRHKHLAQQAETLRLQQKQEINQLKAQMQGEEQERQRIARELHDGIASQLWAIRLNVDNIQQTHQADPAVNNKKMADVFSQLTDVTSDVRKTAHNLMPDLLLEEGLATAIASLCSRTGKSTSLEVDFQEYGIVPAIYKDIELSIYRMVQELIQNVMKHAYGATHLLVQISCVKTLLNITVEDNGMITTEKANKTDGIGLQQIRKRTLTLNGHFDLQMISGKGTTAYLEFDLERLL